jgi:hypothetical protein
MRGVRRIRFVPRSAGRRHQTPGRCLCAAKLSPTRDRPGYRRTWLRSVPDLPHAGKRLMTATARSRPPPPTLLQVPGADGAGLSLPHRCPRSALVPGSLEQIDRHRPRVARAQCGLSLRSSPGLSARPSRHFRTARSPPHPRPLTRVEVACAGGERARGSSRAAVLRRQPYALS